MAEEIIIKKKGVDMRIVDEITVPPPSTGVSVEARNTVTVAYGVPAKVVSEAIGETTYLDFAIPEGKSGKDGIDGIGKDGISPTVEVGSTATLPAGSAATVTSSPTATGIKLNFGIPQGIQGLQGPSSGAGGGAATTRGVYAVYDFGAKGDGVSDDTAAFQNCFNSAIANDGVVYIPNAANFWKLTNTINVIPQAGQGQVWIDLLAVTRAGDIRYSGPSGTAVFKIVGLKGGSWEGLSVSIETGRNNCQVIDVITTGGADSSSFNTLRNFYLNLGGNIDAAAGNASRNENNVGIRTGVQSPGDISNYNFENMTVFGGGRTGASGAESIPGQHAFQNLGVNTLSMCWYGGFVAYCDRAYANKSGGSRGNGSVMFYGLGGSQNNIDFEFAWEQSYIISGGRWEGGNKFLRISDGGYSSIVVQGLTIHDYKTDTLIEAQRACALTLQNVQMVRTATGAFFNNCVTVNSNGSRIGALNITNCTFSLGSSVAVPYVKSGTGQWAVTTSGNVRTDSVWSTTRFTGEFDVVH